MKEIALTHEKVAIVDDDLYDHLRQWNWYASRHKDKWYAVRSEGNKKIYMHRQIMQASPDVEIDHRDGNGLHNWRKNLRNCTHAQNVLNRPANAGRKYKGVFWHKRNKIYQAQIQINRKQIWLGNFETAEDAAVAYNHAALEHFGSFAYFNNIPGWQSITPKRRPGFEKLRINPKSGRKYIAWHCRFQKWTAQLSVNGKRVHVGYFDNVEEAARAQDEKRQDFARTNF